MFLGVRFWVIGAKLSGPSDTKLEPEMDSAQELKPDMESAQELKPTMRSANEE